MVLIIEVTGKPDHIKSFISDLIEVLHGSEWHMKRFENRIRIRVKDRLQLSNVVNIMYAHSILVDCV